MARRFVLCFLGACAAFGALVAMYFAYPAPFFFRAWEYQSLVVYEGYGERSQRFYETGDSARNFLVQRYGASHTVSVNALGNRPGCYDERPRARHRVLVIGDSQLFGMGTGDEGTLTRQLCREFGAAFYSGAGRHGLDMLRHPDYRFDAILFTQTERTLASHCYPGLDHLVDPAAPRKAREDYLLPDEHNRKPLTPYVQSRLKHLSGFLSSRLRALLLGRWMAPERHLDLTAPHRVADAGAVDKRVDCAKQVRDYYERRGVRVGFLIFPAHQTLYADELGVKPDAATARFVDDLAAAMAKARLRSFNSKQCLEAAKRERLVYLPHDTHLNADGFGALARCAKASPLAALFD